MSSHRVPRGKMVDGIVNIYSKKFIYPSVCSLQYKLSATFQLRIDWADYSKAGSIQSAPSSSPNPITAHKYQNLSDENQGNPHKG